MEKNIIDNQSQNNFYSNILFVSDLPKETKNQDLENLFNNYHFIQASLNNSKENRIWAQVILENEEWATKARHELNGFFLVPQSANSDKSKGKPIRICKYESKYVFNNNENNNNINIDNKRNLLVTNLDSKMTQMEFYNIFIQYGDISSGKIEFDEDGRSRGFGYIYYYDESSAEEAKKKLNNKEFYGKRIQIVNLIPGKVKKKNKNITIFALNLPNNITEKEIRTIFQKYGEILNISLTNKGFAYINYSTNAEASACLSDIKSHPISFSGLPNLIVKYATSKEEREANKTSYKNLKKNDDLYKMFFKLIVNDEEIQNIYDLDKKIRLFIKIIFITEYIPTAVEVNEKIKCGIVTFNNFKDCQIFVDKFKEYCMYNRPMFNCIPYNKIKSKLTHNFINLDNYNQNINNDNTNKESRSIDKNNFIENNSSNDDININNYNSNLSQNFSSQFFNDNKTHNLFRYIHQFNNAPLSNDVLFNNNLNFPNYSQINNFPNQKNNSCYHLNIYKNNINYFNSINQYNNPIFNKNLNNNLNNNIDYNIFKNLNNNNYNQINNINNFSNDKTNKKINNSQKEKNIKIYLKPSEFDTPPKCYYNSNNQKFFNYEENIVEISDSIYQIVHEKYPKEAGKITGMIKDLGLSKMNLLLSKPDDLNEIIEKAHNMIIEAKNK